jgi:hypothetical protein
VGGGLDAAMIVKLAIDWRGFCALLRIQGEGVCPFPGRLE